MTNQDAAPAGFSRRELVLHGAAAFTAALLPGHGAAQAVWVLNDASRLNPTPVLRHSVVRDSPEDVLVSALRRELGAAAREGRTVSLGSARHSMGGQTLHPWSTALTFDQARCEPDAAGRVFRSAAGARWREVIHTLDPLGFSPAVMQSNNDFASRALCRSTHGWPLPFGPFGTKVKAFRLMLADGSIVRCARDENAELFGLVIGGYGLFGVILDAEVEITENLVLEPSFQVIASSEFGA